MISNKEVTKALNSNTKKIEYLDELYSTISTDLSIEKFNGEDDISFKCRLVYSTLGKWIMNLFLDKNVISSALSFYFFIYDAKDFKVFETRHV